MIKIDSLGNEQIANVLIKTTVEKIERNLKTRQPVFLAFEHQITMEGNAVDILAKVGIGLENLFSEIQAIKGVNNANTLFFGFTQAITAERLKNSRG